ncbi:hypothetical protein niasHS_009160 [Heterodera schachtii]|uniref:Uncharacterized protein n=1 Tax=Heterodera schachtii TaxID=97005 RepID=A0ABD2JEI6_HETSC
MEKVLLLLLVLLQCGFTSSYGKYDCFVTIRHRSGTPPDEMVKYVKENAQLNADIVNSDPIKTCALGEPTFWEKNVLGKRKSFKGCHNFRCLDGNGNDIFVISAYKAGKPRKSPFGVSVKGSTAWLDLSLRI